MNELNEFVITSEQEAALDRLVKRYSELPLEIGQDSPWYDDPVGTLYVQFPFIFIGIEPDGYAHS